MPEERKLIGIIKAIVISIILIWLSLASLLSFISMCFIVMLFAIPTIIYSSPIMFPLVFAIFLFMSQLIPGYFSQNKKMMLIPLIFSTLLVGVAFSVLLGIIKGLIYAVACFLGNYMGYTIREKHR